MQINISVSSATTKRVIVMGIVGAAVAAASLAWAGLKEFGPTEVLTATDLNGNFNSLQKEIDALRTKVDRPTFSDWQRLQGPPQLIKVGGEVVPTKPVIFVHHWRREGDSAHVRACVTGSDSAAGDETIAMTLAGLPPGLTADTTKVSGPVRMGLATLLTGVGYETCSAVWIDDVGGAGVGVGVLCASLNVVSAKHLAGRELCLDVVVPVAGWSAAKP